MAAKGRNRAPTELSAIRRSRRGVTDVKLKDWG